MKALILVSLSVTLLYSAQSREANVSGTAARATTMRLEYTLITANSPDCPGFQAYPAPELQYRQTTDSEWTTINNIEPVNHTSFTISKRARLDVSRFVLDLQLNDSQELQNSAQFRFVQLEHRGGFCDCWAVANLTLDESIDLNMQCGKKANLEEIFEMPPNQLLEYDHDDVIAGFCQDTALIPRECIAVQGQTGSPPPNCTSIPHVSAPWTNCGTLDMRIEVSFDLQLLISGCDGVDDFSEGVELAFRSVLKDGTTTDWIPLMFFAPNLKIDQPYVWLIPTELSGSSGSFSLRGYNVTYTIQSQKISYNYNISMCGGDILQHPLQFQWLQNAYQVHPIVKDVVLMDNVTVRVKNSTHYAVLLEDCFDYQNSLTASRWNLSLSYNVHQDLPNTNTQRCPPSAIVDRALLFYPLLPENFFSLPTLNDSGVLVYYSVNSRQLVTNSLDPNVVDWSLLDQQTENVLTCEPEVTTTTIRAETTTESERMTTHIDELVTTMPEVTTTIDTTITEVPTEDITSLIELAVINSGAGLYSHLHSLTLFLNKGEDYTGLALESLNTLLSSIQECDVNLTAAVSVLSLVVKRYGEQTVEQSISKLVLAIGSRLLQIAQTNCSPETKDDPPEVLAVSTLLRVIDKFALNNHNVSHKITSGNIEFLVEELKLNETMNEIRSLINGTTGFAIYIPVREVLSTSENRESVRMASILFRNMSGLLPERLREEADNNISSDLDDVVFRLASPVISASFQCDTCTTSNLSTPVQVIFKHTPYDQALLENDLHGLVKCVFWQFDESLFNDQTGAILYPGQWSEEGCETKFTSATTLCRCNHLTHFAILLSARPLKLSQQKILSLQIIGYIGVSISLVAMAATVFVFLFLECKINATVSKKRPLVTMRNYIHIQLCVTLSIAQIIFVAGIEPRLGEGHLVGGVPIGCRLVAVLLHYWFLVSFMWMLIEGVVLYVALVRVFVSHHARYIAAFTIASYGLPLVYVGGLTVPLGFARSDNIRGSHTYDYGYEQACYLNPATSFIWSFITPVILILLANIGFFVMAVIIKYRNQNRQHHKGKAKHVWNWLKASISLTVVMGITWIIGVLVIEVEELFAIVLIFTIFVAFQGLFIFVIFVLLQKPVRESYAKWWKAKVAESDYLSRYFGEKFPPPSTLTTQRSAPSQEANVAVSVKFELSRSEVMKNSFVEDGPVHNEEEEKHIQNFGTFFNITQPDSASAVDEENRCKKKRVFQ